MRGAPLTLRGVHVHAGGIHILNGVDLRLLPGELCALIGPSGAGKSTLIRSLLGLIDPDKGEVRLGQTPVADAGPVGYVPQYDKLHETLTVERALDFAVQLRLPELDAAGREKLIAGVCRQVDLHERRDVRIRRLSGGQKKRVSVALELLTGPPVLILDEPTSGLDPGLEARMMRLFQKLAAEGRVVLVSTHAMQSLELCTHVIVLVRGHIAWFGPPAQMLEWFRAGDFAQIFEQLPKRKPTAWQNAYYSSATRAQMRQRTLNSAPTSAPAPATPSPAAAAPADLDAQLAALKAGIEAPD